MSGHPIPPAGADLPRLGAPVPDAADAGPADLPASVVDDLRLALASPVDDAVAERHLAALFAEADALAATDRHASSAPVAAFRSRRRLAVAAAGVAVALGATSGLAAANMLPAPAQDAVAATAEVFGVDLPSSDDVPDTTPGGEAPARPSSTTGDPTDPGQTDGGETGELPSQGSGQPTDPGQPGPPPGQDGTNPGQGNPDPDPGDGNQGQGQGSGQPTDPGQPGPPPGQDGTNPGQGNPDPGDGQPGQAEKSRGAADAGTTVPYLP